MKLLINKILSKRGLRIINEAKRHEDMFADPVFRTIHQKTQEFTMTNPENMYALCQSVDHVLSNHIEGAFIECGVWRGGSSMTMIQRLMQHDVTDRSIMLFDLFVTPDTNGEEYWRGIPLNEVETNVRSLGYPGVRISFHK